MEEESNSNVIKEKKESDIDRLTKSLREAMIKKTIYETTKTPKWYV